VSFTMATLGVVLSQSHLHPDSSTRSASKVRVTYFESKRPLTLPSPEASDAEWDDTMAEPPLHHPNYNRQISNESGQDNPFRPDGDLSREADELVELLKGGRPISEVLKPKEEVPSSASPTAEEPVAEEQPFLAASPDRNSLASPTNKSPTNKSPTNKSPDVGVNGVKTPEAEKKVVEKEVEASKSVEVERAVVAPTEANPSQAEHVVIKKKSKCQCCVIQ